MNTAANKLFKSISGSTLFTLATIAISFLMLPFLVHKLGVKWYGIWTVISSMTCYYYLVDFGLATAVTRYTTQHLMKQEYEKANSIINTSLIIYFALAVAIAGLSLVISLFVPFFVSTADDSNVIRLVIIILGVNLASTFPFKAFVGIIGAYLRYDLTIANHFLGLFLTTGLTVLFLNKGYGIIAISIIALACAQLQNVIFFFIAKHLFSELKLSRSYVNREQVSELFNYSRWSFVSQLGDQLRFRVDSFVIGYTLSVSQVTHYFIGARLAELFLTLASKTTIFLTPLFTRYHALNNYEDIRTKMLFVTKINTALAVFGGGLIILLGKPFILRWMGAEYIDAYPILVVLIIALAVEIINQPSYNVLYAISKHRYLAKINMIEGTLNLLISLVLVKHYGIIGVAIGTAIPLVVIKLIVLPPYVCKCIDLPLKKYYLNILPLTIFTSGYLFAFLLIAEDTLLVPNYGALMVAIVSAVPLYAIGAMLLCFQASEREQIRTAFI